MHMDTALSATNRPEPVAERSLLPLGARCGDIMLAAATLKGNDFTRVLSTCLEAHMPTSDSLPTASLPMVIHHKLSAHDGGKTKYKYSHGAAAGRYVANSGSHLPN